MTKNAGLTKNASEWAHVSVHVHPQSSKPGISALCENVIHIRLRAAPVEGKANDELVRLLADCFKISRQSVRILSGERGKRKIVALRGMSAEAILLKIRELLRVGESGEKSIAGDRHQRSNKDN